MNRLFALCFALTLSLSLLSAERSLGGLWKLKVIDGGDWSDYADFFQPDYDDSLWRTIPVPGCWERYAFCPPFYTKSKEPYDLDLTGFYRTTFPVPKERKGQRVFLRFDGVLRGYQLWVNGQDVGSWELPYDSKDWDITPFVKTGVNSLAMRVYSRYKGYGFDCFDDWAFNGIFRDVTLFTLPECHVDDVTFTTDSLFPAVGGVAATVTAAYHLSRPESVHGLTFRCLLRGPQGDIVHDFGSTKVKGDSLRYTCNISGAQLWTAETPALYTLEYTLSKGKKLLQSERRKVGIRRITVDGPIIRLNGQPIKFRGVNYHETWPSTGKVMSDSIYLADMRMMKAASVNFLRLSHYPHSPRFYELADSMGFYLVNEVTFGKGDNDLYKKDYLDILLRRALATVTRDKNHPSVLIWSVGNENPLTDICKKTGRYVQSLDPTRPICFPQVGSYFRKIYDAGQIPEDIDILAPHYLNLDNMRKYAGKTPRPMLFTEYCHSLGFSLEDHDLMWEMVEDNDNFAGGAVWEWADQGLTMPIGGEDSIVTGDYYGYNELLYPRRDSRVSISMYGNFGTDGILTADRHPLPNYYEVAHNYAQLKVMGDSCSVAGGVIRLTLANRYDFTPIDTLRWYLNSDFAPIDSGFVTLSLPPHARTEVTITPSFSLEGLRDHCVTLSLCCPQYRRGLGTAQRYALPLWRSVPRLLTADTIGYDKPSATPFVRVGRKMTLSERCAKGVRESLIEKYLKRSDGVEESTLCGAVVYDDSTLHLEGTVCQDGDGLVSFDIVPSKSQAMMQEAGLALLLDSAIDRVVFIGQGPWQTVPGRDKAGWYGRHALTADDFSFEGCHEHIDAAFFSGAGGNGLLFVLDDGTMSFERTDKGIVATVCSAVSGVGPKSARTSHRVWADKIGHIKGSFYLYKVRAGAVNNTFQSLFSSRPGSSCPSVCRDSPYFTLYDIYPLRLADISE